MNCKQLQLLKAAYVKTELHELNFHNFISVLEDHTVLDSSYSSALYRLYELGHVAISLKC